MIVVVIVEFVVKSYFAIPVSYHLPKLVWMIVLVYVIIYVSHVAVFLVIIVLQLEAAGELMVDVSAIGLYHYYVHCVRHVKWKDNLNRKCTHKGDRTMNACAVNTRTHQDIDIYIRLL